MNRQFPRLEVDAGRIRSNAQQIAARCRARGIAVCGVIKGVNGLPEIVRTYKEAGIAELGTSRIGELPVPNNDAVTGLARTDYKRMIAVAVLMAPLVEECLFRGVVFGTIRPKSRFWAYAASIALFSLYHVWQYVLVYQDPKLLLSALAYVPVSAALTFCYEQTRSIWPPVFFHMCINALSLTVRTG